MEACSLSAINNLYDNIAHLIGEDPIDELNKAIKERFFLVPALLAYIQGFTNDLLLCLTHLDENSNKRVFQLLMEHLSSGQI